MRLVDYLIALLIAHAEVLTLLQEELGSRVELRALLETSHPKPPSPKDLGPESAPEVPSEESPYEELQTVISSLKLEPELEHYLWQYPHYRAFAESPLTLSHLLVPRHSTRGEVFVTEAIHYAKEWLEELSLSPEKLARIQNLSEPIWARFRTTVLRNLGLRTLGPA